MVAVSLSRFTCMIVHIVDHHIVQTEVACLNNTVSSPFFPEADDVFIHLSIFIQGLQEGLQTVHMGTAHGDSTWGQHDHSHAVSVLSINCQLLHAYRLPVLTFAYSYHARHRGKLV